MLSNRIQDEPGLIDFGECLSCTFCGGTVRLSGQDTFIWLGARPGACCGACAHRMGVSGTYNVCPLCFLPLLGNSHDDVDEGATVLCDSCIEIVRRLEK